MARIRTGDRVFAKDEASGKTGYKPVTARYGNPYQETVYIEISDGIGKIQTLVSNKIHPFYSQGKWIQAGRLKKGDTLLSESGAKQTETFAKFLSLPTAETQTQVFSCFRPKYLLILPKYPLNPPRIPDNQASGLPFRRQRAHLACWPLSTGSNTSLSDGFAHSL
ncbi:TPA: polymorphic toxin-type HINT domain-containing protein [Neisseria meningitidis]